MCKLCVVCDIRDMICKWWCNWIESKYLSKILGFFKEEILSVFLVCFNNDNYMLKWFEVILCYVFFNCEYKKIW